MPSVDNILAQGLQPTTPWKSPVAMEQEQQALVNSRTINQANQLKLQQEQEAMRLATQQRQALMKAAQDAQGDPDKFTQGYLSLTGDQEGALKIQKGFDDHKAALSKLTTDEQAQRLNAAKRATGLLQGIAAEKSPERRLYAAAVAKKAAQAEGLGDLPLDDISDDALLTQINMLGLDGSIAARIKAEKDAEIAAAAEARAAEDQKIQAAAAAVAAQRAPLEVQKLENEVAAGVIDPATGLTKAEASKLADGKLTNDYKNYQLAVPQEKRAEIPYQKWLEIDANLKKPTTVVNVNGKPLTEGAINKLGTLAAHAEKLEGLKDTFQDDFVGNTFTGDIENWLSGKGMDLGLATEGQFGWWQDYREFINEIRKEYFGSALTATEKSEFNRTIISPSMDPKKAKENLQRQYDIANKALKRRVNVYKAGGFNPDQLSEFEDTQVSPNGTTVDVDVIEWETGPDGKPRRKVKP